MSWMKAGLLVVLLSAAAGPQGLAPGRGLADAERCVAEPVDLTEPALKARLAAAKRWSAAGPVITEYPSPGVKKSTQWYSVIDEHDQMIMVASSCSGSCGETCNHSGCELSSGACSGVCQGFSGCGVEGCDPNSTGGCSEVVCTDGEGCQSHCARVNIN